MSKLVILDRDGVINFDSPDYIKSPEEWLPIPGSLEAIARLTQANYAVAIASNQSGLGRGFYDAATLDKIHEKMHNQLALLGGRIDLVLFCPHLPTENCTCRKPKPGLILQILEHFKIENNIEIPVIGDSLRDLQAAKIAGCRPMLVLSGNGRETFSKLPFELDNTEIYSDLNFAVNALLTENTNVFP